MKTVWLLLAFFQGLCKFHFAICSLKLIKKRAGLDFVVYTFLQLRNDNAVFGWSPHFKDQPLWLSIGCWRRSVQNFISLNVLGLLVHLARQQNTQHILWQIWTRNDVCDPTRSPWTIHSFYSKQTTLPKQMKAPCITANYRPDSQVH